MNVTHFVENLNRGGLERVVIDLIQAQLDLGYRCQVVCLFERGSLAGEVLERGIPVLACGKRRGLDVGAVLRARRFIRGHGTDVLHTHNMAAHYHGIAATIGLKLRRRINTRHGMGFLGKPGRRDWLYARTLPATDAVVTVCEAARRDLLARGIGPAEKLVVVPNGIRVDRFAAASEQSRARLVELLGVPTHTRLVGFVGRLNWAKDPATLIRAFAEVCKRLSDVMLVIVGDGQLREELLDVAQSEGVTDRVRFMGDRSDVSELLPGMSLFALSSLTEGYSIALLEACAAGLPIVATAVGGNAEIVRDGINGRIVAPSDCAALATAMHELLADPQRAQRMGHAGREWVLQRGSFRAMAADYAEIYRG